MKKKEGDRGERSKKKTERVKKRERYTSNSLQDWGGGKGEV